MFSNETLLKKNKLFTTHTLELPVGTKLLLFTDGLTEANSISRNESFEDSKMLEVFQQSYDLPGKKFIGNLYKELLTFREKETFDDDICMVCLDIK